MVFSCKQRNEEPWFLAALSNDCPMHAFFTGPYFLYCEGLPDNEQCIFPW